MYNSERKIDVYKKITIEEFKVDLHLAFDQWIEQINISDDVRPFCESAFLAGAMFALSKKLKPIEQEEQ